MTASSKERASKEKNPPAGVLPFEKPQNQQQRAIRTRVRERLERERERDTFRTSPLRVVLTLVVAMVPVLLTIGATDFVLRRVQLLTRLYFPEAPQETAAPEQPTDSQTPGVLMVMPDPTLGPPEAPASGAGIESQSDHPRELAQP